MPPKTSSPYSTGGLTPMAEDFSIEPPEVQLDDSDEKRKKSISRTKQWKEFVAYLRQRQEMYRQQTPGGIQYNNMPKADAAFYSAVGNAVYEEYESAIKFIEGG